MSAYLSASLIVAASLLVGSAITSREGGPSGASPAVGLAVLILLTLVTIRLPGHGVTAAAACALAALTGAGVLLRSRSHVPQVPRAGVAAAVGTAAACSLPFVSNERVGILGPSVLNDLAFHMAQADAMRTLGGEADMIAAGYPSGPHALIAALSETGLGIEPGFTGLLPAAAILASLTALALVPPGPWPLRALAATLAGAAYLPVSYLAESAFKEPMLGLFILGFVVTLHEARAARAVVPRHLTALALTAGAGIATLGAAALAWPAAVLLWLGLLVRASTPGRPLLPRTRRPVIVGGAMALLLVVGSASVAAGGGLFDTGPGRYLTDRGIGGNYVGQLSPFEALGAWPAGDFRFIPPLGPLLVAGVVLSVLLVAHGVAWSWRRDRLALLAGALGVATVYAVAWPVTLAYFSGKALVIASPLLTVLAAGPLIARSAADEQPPARRLALAALAAYAGIAIYSSALALRYAHVRPSDRGPDLERFHSFVDESTALYLGRDDYAPWDLRAGRLSGYQGVGTRTQASLEPRREKLGGDAPGPAVDVDSIDSWLLDNFRYLVTSRTGYASEPPENFRVVARTRWHLLWKRRGPTPPRATLNEGEAPGAVLDCDTPEGRLLLGRNWRATVRPRPLTRPAAAWPNGGTVASGGSLSQELTLPAGTWELSTRWYSDVPLEIQAGRLRRTLPPFLGDRSSFAAIGTLRSTGRPLTVTVKMPARAGIAPRRTAEVGALAATRTGVSAREVPLSEACGRYVDYVTPEAP